MQSDPMNNNHSPPCTWNGKWGKLSQAINQHLLPFLPLYPCTAYATVSWFCCFSNKLNELFLGLRRSVSLRLRIVGLMENFCLLTSPSFVFISVCGISTASSSRWAKFPRVSSVVLSIHLSDVHLLIRMKLLLSVFCPKKSVSYGPTTSAAWSLGAQINGQTHKKWKQTRKGHLSLTFDWTLGISFTHWTGYIDRGREEVGSGRLTQICWRDTIRLFSWSVSPPSLSSVILLQLPTKIVAWWVGVGLTNPSLITLSRRQNNDHLCPSASPFLGSGSGTARRRPRDELLRVSI